MAKMRRALESEDKPAKRKSILRKALENDARAKMVTASGAVKDHSTPNQVGGGIQTKIPQFLKDAKNGGKAATNRPPLANVNGNQLNDRSVLIASAFKSCFEIVKIIKGLTSKSF